MIAKETRPLRGRSLLNSRYVLAVLATMLRHKISEISNSPPALLRNASLESLGGNHDMFAGWNLAHLVIGDDLIAIERQAELSFTRHEKNCDRKMM